MSAWDGTIPCHPIDSARIVYIEIPKAGCTSIKHALTELKGGPPPPEDDIHHWLGYTHARDLGQLFRWLDTRWRDYFRFTVVRDPVTRFESFYYDKVSPADRYIYGSIDGYVERGFVLDDWHRDIHAIPQTFLIGTDLGRFDFVGRVEDMDEVAAVLSAQTQVLVSIPVLNVGQSPRRVLRNETIARLMAIYEADILALAPLYAVPVA